MSSNAVYFLLGPTACGKTDVSLKLAQRLDAEIVSVDSALVYRGMNIGSAKPGEFERQQVPHHLIDICDPAQPYSVAQFCSDALGVIGDIQQRGRRALLTGGTMLYFNALEHGLAPLPDADTATRDAISEEAQTRGWPALHEELTRVDADAARRIHPNDPQRLQRALEVFRLTGVPLSELQKRTKPMLQVPPVKIALMPDSRAWLHERIGRRFRAMIDAGFIDEVRALRADTNLHKELPSMRSVGYRQAWQHLDGEYDLDEMIARAEAATRQLAKRQITWIRGMHRLQRIACDTVEVNQQVDSILALLQQTS